MSKIRIIISILVILVILIILIIIGMILYFNSLNNDGLIYNLECEELGTPIKIDLHKKGWELLKHNGKYYLFVKLGEQSSGGYSIKIEDVKVRKNKVDVYVSTESPGPYDMVTMAFTYPYDVVEFNKKPHGINIIY